MRKAMQRSLLYGLFALCGLAASRAAAQGVPAFGAEKAVEINGLALDAMEPFISADGNRLFFNSLNSGGNTNVYYATRINDTTFQFAGLVNGIYDASPNHLDAVASMDIQDNWYWVSLRTYPSAMETLHRGAYQASGVSAISRVYGNFNIYTFAYPYGWLVMDAAIDYQGNRLYYCNALFDFSNTTCPGLPCKARLGQAQKTNDSTFTKLPDSDAVFSRINDTSYLAYAPQVTPDGLELYYTRLLRGGNNTEICVSVRQNLTDTFSSPALIHSRNGFLPEAPTLTPDKQKLYYHQKNASGSYRIFLRYRIHPGTGVAALATGKTELYPNPAQQQVTIPLLFPGEAFRIQLYTSTGYLVMITSTQNTLDLSELSAGMYCLVLNQRGRAFVQKLFKE